MFRALKPGGVLGVVQHRGDPKVKQDPKAGTGYVNEDYVIGLAKKAGFELAEKSEINANPKDTKNYPKGVWTLPPLVSPRRQGSRKVLGRSAKATDDAEIREASELGPREFLVFDALRQDGILAEAALLVLLVGFEIAFEPLHVAVALEGQDVGGDAVEEEAIVADDHGAAGEVFERRFERGQSLDIEVVGRLIEQDQVRA